MVARDGFNGSYDEGRDFDLGGIQLFFSVLSLYFLSFCLARIK